MGEGLANDIPRLVIDSGRRDALLAKPRAFSEALQQAGIPFDLRGADSSVGIEPDDIVVAMSSTVNYETLRPARLVYPTAEQLTTCVDKWGLYEWSRQNGIVTPLTLMMPATKIAGLETPEQMLNAVRLMDRQLGGSIVKPRFPMGVARTICRHVYNQPGNDEVWNTIVQHANITHGDFVFQKRVPGEVMKVYGVRDGSYWMIPLGSKQDAQVCPENISRTCQFVLREFGLHWGGFDFIVNEKDGLWYFMDLNPTTGGKKAPEELKEKLVASVRRSIQSMISKPTETEENKRNFIQPVITVAGVNQRLQSEIGQTPKSLVRMPDGERILDKVIRMARIFSACPGYANTIQIMHLDIHEKQFLAWQQETKDPAIELVTPDGQKLSDTPPSTVNQIFATLPESDYALMIGGDRLIDVPQEELEKAASQAREAFKEGKYAYVVVGVPTEASKYSYTVDQNGTITRCTIDGETEGVLHIKKLVFLFDTRKMLFGEAKNTRDVVVRMTEAGVLGKLIMLNNVTWIGDMDTPEDLREFQEHFSEKELPILA